jgi:hypothetical protein
VDGDRYTTGTGFDDLIKGPPAQVLSVLYSYMEDWRWRMDALSGLGIESPDYFERKLRTRPARLSPQAAPYDQRRAKILAAGGEVG